MIPGSANALLLASAAEAGGYEIERSLRFNSSDSAYLGRTPSTAGNRKTWTWAGWVKRSRINNSWVPLFEAYDGSSFAETNYLQLTFYLDQIGLATNNVWFRRTTAVYRDYSAWMHIVCAFDTTQVTGANRVKIYVNGAQITDFTASSDPTINTDYGVNRNVEHETGRRQAANYFDGYLADVFFVDGQALDPTSFGEFDDNGIWQPIEYTGTYGTNGFHLPFSDNSTAAALGTDTSGNSNDWTVNNISVAAGAGNDSLVDTPTNYGTDSGAGGEVRGNYCTWNPLINGDTAANGNLDVTNDTARGTQKLLEYDAYWEITSTGGTTTAGVVSDGGTTNTTTVADGKTYGFKLSVAGALEYINITDGGSFTSITTGLTGIQFPYASAASSTTGSLNAGQRPFAAPAPSGFKALCTTNLPAPVVAKPSTVMDVKLYTGNGSTQTISGLGFSPDFVWIKPRNQAWQHNLYDSVRGATKALFSDYTDAETTVSNGLTAFNSDGFTLGANQYVNNSSTSFVGWTWDAGSSTVTLNPGDPGAGSITSQVRANASAGFSIVTYTGAGSAGTVGHGLGAAPGLVILKDRTFAAGTNWQVYHASIGNTSSINLNTTGTPNSDIGWWNNTSPTSTVFSVGTYNAGSSNYVAYCFAPVAGYSSMGSYVSTGTSDNAFNFCGFKPRFLLLKNATVGNSWVILDSARSTFNAADDWLGPNSSSAEDPNNAAYSVDFLSNGFKVRSGNGIVGNSGDTVVWAAFAESPFQYARAR